jgi:hypothetical protein
MRDESRSFLLLAGAGMELSWLYAWASFLMISIIHRPFPLPEAIGAFGLATILTLVSQGREWRVIYILLAQVVGFIIAAFRIVYVFNYPSYSFVSGAWLPEFFTKSREPLEWFLLVFILIWIFAFWVGGIALARRSPSYLAICTRFDLGVAALMLLLLIKFLLLVKGGLNIEAPMVELLIFPFFPFSLLAIALARNQSKAQRDFLPGYRVVGMALGFTVVVLLFGTGLVLLFLPYLRIAAEFGYGLLRSTAGELSPILVSILRFWFFSSRYRPEPPSGSLEGEETEFVTSYESSWWSELLAKIIGFGFLGLVGLILLVMMALGLWYLLRWLLSRSYSGEKREIQWNLLWLWAAKGWEFLLLWRDKVVHRLKGFHSAVQLYGAMLGWGRRSGLPRLLSETPIEYGSRLIEQFPAVKREIWLIVEAFNQEVYGEKALNERQLTKTQLAWRRLQSPFHWPSRIKSWFLQPADKSHGIQ